MGLNYDGTYVGVSVVNNSAGNTWTSGGSQPCVTEPAPTLVISRGRAQNEHRREPIMQVHCAVNRLDQARVIVLDVSDALARPAGHPLPLARCCHISNFGGP